MFAWGGWRGQDEDEGVRKDEVRRLRLARNRESAKESRRKKKEKLVLLEMQVPRILCMCIHRSCMYIVISNTSTVSSTG